MTVPAMDKGRFTKDELVQLAANGVTKIDLMGARGATLVTTDELEAMAIMLAASNTLPAYPQRVTPPNPNKRITS